MQEWVLDRKQRHLLTNDEDFVRAAITKMTEAPDDTFSRHWMTDAGHFLTFGKEFEFENVAEYMVDFVGSTPKEYSIIYSHQPPYVRDGGHLKVELIPDIITTAEILRALQEEDLTILAWKEYEANVDYVNALSLDGDLQHVRQHRDLVVQYRGLNDIIGSLLQRGVVAQGMSFGITKVLLRPDRDLNASELDIMSVATTRKKDADVQTERPPQLISRAAQTMPSAPSASPASKPPPAKKDAPPPHPGPTKLPGKAKPAARGSSSQDGPKGPPPPKKDAARNPNPRPIKERVKPAKRTSSTAQRQCYRCQSWSNHLAVGCSAPLRCRRCAGTHASKGCKEAALKCTNCGEEHQASSRRCKSRPKADPPAPAIPRAARDSGNRAPPASQSLQRRRQQQPKRKPADRKDPLRHLLMLVLEKLLS